MDRMVEQNRSGTLTEIVCTPTGQKFALMNGTTLKKAFIQLPGSGTAVYTSAGLDHYRHSDWLGSNRLSSSTTRTVLSTVAYAPFAETYAASGTPDLSFTGQSPDTTSGDYDFLYREYSNQGRWASPDPAGLSAVNPTFPQSWNRYAYVLNAPTELVDASGLYLQCVQGILFNRVDYSVDNTYQGSDYYIVGLCDSGTAAGGGGAVGGTGGSGHGGRGKKPKPLICSLIPSGGVVSAGGSAGTLGGTTGSFDIVSNYDSGEVSLIGSSGGFVGFNGGGSAQVSSGLVFGDLRSNNSGYSGPFTSGAVSYKIVGINVARGSGGLSAPLSFSGPLVISATGGPSLFGAGTVTTAITKSSQPSHLGNLTDAPLPSVDYFFYLLRQIVCK
ncbi:MAG TPA: RHS repeat-associated core domain-containing protein [Candidatus Acidoferrum sp.]|jgi:RHS repeat-associated protein